MLHVPELAHRSSVAGCADESSPRPRLVFFKYKWSSGLPDFLLTHTREHVACLSQFFEVFVVDEDCDYQQVCDKYEPDLALFESGINISTCHRIKIANVQRYSNVPKLGFFNADAWCETRSGILSEMDHWQIDTFFSIAVTAGEHTPAISSKLFVWPNGVDSGVYHDYAQPKLIPILLSGAIGPQYPWRRRVFSLVSKHYPALSCPHHGYTSRAGVAQVLHGEAYARTLNASVFAPACGTLAKEIVRKHFEIPACGACLITEKSPGLEAAGFVDMQNCVFADDRNVLDKISWLFENAETLTRITQAGHDLVHSRHTFKHRNQVLQWLRLHQNLKPGERIIQINPFAPLSVAGADSEPATYHVISNGLHLSLVRKANQLLWAGEFEAAEANYAQCLKYMSRLPEAKFGLAVCKLHQGKPHAAQDVLVELLQYTLAEYNAADPDPVEWAAYVLIELCLGDVSAALRRSNQFSNLSHPELERVRWVARLLANGAGSAFPVDGGNQRRVSLHQVPVRSPGEWVGQLITTLAACGQNQLADAVWDGFWPPVGNVRKTSQVSHFETAWQRIRAVVGKRSDGAGAFRRRFFYSKLRRRLAPVSRMIPQGSSSRRGTNA
jgi:hypothetical protein